jgi:hypothetical protein
LKPDDRQSASPLPFALRHLKWVIVRLASSVPFPHGFHAALAAGEST